jgi:RimJ/RimL family protein N-acetyltransferase
VTSSVPGRRHVRTKHFFLEPLADEHFPLLDAFQRDARVMATLGGVRSEDETRRHVDEQVAHWAAHGFGLWIARAADTGVFVGRAGLRHVEAAGLPEVEVAYALVPDLWGRGLGTELAAECVRFGFEELGRSDLVCFTMTTNAASRRVMEKAGFRYEREFERAGLPHVLMRLRVADWRRQVSATT